MKTDFTTAQNMINHLKCLSKEPEKILTYLYPKTESYDHNRQMTEFSSMILIEGKDIYTYLENYISEVLHLQNDVMVSHWGNHFHISIKGLYPEEDLFTETFGEPERIFEFDILNHTYEAKNFAMRRYNALCEANYELNLDELPEDWELIKDLSFIGKAKTIYRAMKNKNLSSIEKMESTMLFLALSNSDLNKRIQKVEADIEKTNKKRKTLHERKIKEQQFYKEHAPAYIKRIESIQKQMINFLESYGYTNKIKIQEEF